MKLCLKSHDRSHVKARDQIVMLLQTYPLCLHSYLNIPYFQGQALHYDSNFRLVPADLCVGSKDLTVVA